MFRFVQTIVVGGLLILIICPTGCRREQMPPRSMTAPEASSSDVDPMRAAHLESHQKMLTTLADVAKKASDDNHYVGDLQRRKMLEALDERPGDALSPTDWRLRYSLAQAELLLGNEKAATEHFAKAMAIGRSISEQMPEEAARSTILAMAIAYLRIGETENCCALNSPESCLFPIRPSAIHTKTNGSRQAIGMLEVFLETAPNPTDNACKKAKWLLNIAYMTLGEHPDKVPPKYLIPLERIQSEEEFPSFPNVAAKVGLSTFSLAGGSVTEDFDRDGDLDILVTDWDPASQMCYFENDGNGSFANRTEAAGLTGLIGGLNMVQADYNNDGFEDVYILRGAWQGRLGCHPNSLLRNNGDGTFTDVTFAVGLGQDPLPTQTASWADYDLDGDVDLFVGCETLSLLGEDPKDALSASQLFRNNGDETFTNVTESSGTANMRFAKGVVWGDYNNDRWPDLYVSNLADENRLYHNNGDGTFRDVAPELDVVKPSSSFPVWFWDYNNDGYLDILASSYAARTPDIFDYFVGNTPNAEPMRLYQGNGTSFVDVTEECRLVRPSNPMGANFGDLNNDGYLDFYFGTGSPPIEQLMPNVMYLNKGGLRFADITTAGGFGNLQKGHAVSFADLDGDGDQDVFEQMGGAYLGDKYFNVLYENPGFGNHWISIRVEGVESNRSGIGTRIKAIVRENGVERSIYKRINSGGSFGCNSLTQIVGLGQANVIDRLEVYWPKSDTTQVFTQVDVDQRIVIKEFADEYQVLAAQ